MLRTLRLNTLAAALVAAAAACAEGPTAAGGETGTPTPEEAAPAPGQSRMLHPGQEREVRPGDFIMFRPEEYARYGIRLEGGRSSTLAAPSAPAAAEAPVQIGYGTDAVYYDTVSSNGARLKQLQLKAWSVSTANVASFSLVASFRRGNAESGSSCGNAAQEFDAVTFSGTGAGRLESSRVVQWLGTVRFEVAGTHTFTSMAGATGGGTFTSSDGFCG